MSDTPHLPIGAFSNETRLSIRMLRHYDEQGLLRPAEVDPVTGYRRYAPEQVAAAVRIRNLRDVGFTVSAIAAVLAAHGSDAYQRALRMQRDVLTTELRDAENRVHLIDRMITNEGQDMNDITVTRATLPAETIVALRGVIPSYPEEGRLWERFMPALGAQGITPIGPGGVIEHDGEYRESDVDESVWLPVAPGTTASEPLEVIALPEREVVMARIVGPYSLITEAHTRIGTFARENGISLACGGPDAPIAERNGNRYLTTPGSVSDDEHVTEVWVPIAG